MRRLERPTSRPPDVYSNQLSYIPNEVILILLSSQASLTFQPTAYSSTLKTERKGTLFFQKKQIFCDFFCFLTSYIRFLRLLDAKHTAYSLNTFH